MPGMERGLVMKILLSAMLPLMLVSCESIPCACPDMTPIGTGLRFLGVALVVAVLVAVIGDRMDGGST